MNRARHRFLYFLYPALVLLLLFMVTACASLGKKEKATGPVQASPARLENALPADSYFAFLLNVTGQPGTVFRALENRLVPEGKLIAPTIKKFLANASPLYAPILGDNPLLAVAVAPPVTSAGPGIAIVALANRAGDAGFTALSDDLKQNWGYEEKKLGNHAGVIYRPAKEHYVGRVGELIVLGNEAAVVQAALDRVSSGAGGITGAKHYQSLRQELKADESLAFFYYQPAASVAALLSGLREEVGKTTVKAESGETRCFGGEGTRCGGKTKDEPTKCPGGEGMKCGGGETDAGGLDNLDGGEPAWGDDTVGLSPLASPLAPPEMADFTDLLDKDTLAAYEAVAAAIHTDSEGFSLRGVLLADKDKLAARGLSLNPTTAFTPRLIKQLPLEKQFLAVETFDSKTGVDQLWRYLQSVPTNAGSPLAMAAPQLSALREQIRMYTGMDIWDDVIAWMTKGTLFSVGYSGPLPDFTLAVEAGQAEDKARKLLSVLGLFANLAKTEVPGLQVSQEKLAGGDFTKLQLDMGSLGLAPAGATNLSVVFGLTADKLLVISNNPDLVASYGKGDSAVLTKLLGRVPKEVEVVIYLQPANLAKLLRGLNASSRVSSDFDLESFLSFLEKSLGAVAASKSSESRSDFYGYLYLP